MLARPAGDAALGTPEALRAGVALHPGEETWLEALSLSLRDTAPVLETRRWLRRAAQASAGRARTESALALIEHQTGNWRSARRHGRRALALDPAYPETPGTLAATALELGEADEAIVRLERTIALAPRWYAPHANLGNALRSKGRFRAAIVAFRRSLALEPRSAPVWSNLAQGEQEQLDGKRAEACLQRALAIALNPAVHSNLVFVRSYRPEIDERTLFATVRQWGERFTEPRPRAAIQDPDPERRLRIGYLSADFRSHPVGWNLIGLIEQHDRGRIETFAYPSGRADAMTDRFRRGFEHWRPSAGLDDPALAALIAADRIDILVVVAGHTQGGRLGVAGLWPAPVQVSMHDLTSSGVSAVDHWLTDPLLCPQETAELFVETPVRLPSFYLHMPPSAIDAPMPSAVAERRPVIFGCCNNPAKLNDAVLRLWAEVLKAAPASRLTFRYFQHFASEDGKAPIVAGLRRHGIDAHRLMFETGGTERDDQLRHLGSIDIALDPFPFNGATTTFEALWMGLPVVTLAGRRFVGRVAAAHLQLVGLGDLVAESPEEYVRIAAGLAAAPDRRARLRRELRSRVLASPLCDAHAYARSVERAYREMWRARCVGSVWDGNLLEG